MAKSKKVQSRAPNASRPHMPGYGLPKGTKGLLPWGWAEQRLKKSHNSAIADFFVCNSGNLKEPLGTWNTTSAIYPPRKIAKKSRNISRNCAASGPP